MACATERAPEAVYDGARGTAPVAVHPYFRRLATGVARENPSEVVG